MCSVYEGYEGLADDGGTVGVFSSMDVATEAVEACLRSHARGAREALKELLDCDDDHLAQLLEGEELTEETSSSELSGELNATLLPEEGARPAPTEPAALLNAFVGLDNASLLVPGDRVALAAGVALTDWIDADPATGRPGPTVLYTPLHAFGGVVVFDFLRWVVPVGAVWVAPVPRFVVVALACVLDARPLYKVSKEVVCLLPHWVELVYVNTLPEVSALTVGSEDPKEAEVAVPLGAMEELSRFTRGQCVACALLYILACQPFALASLYVHFLRLPYDGVDRWAGGALGAAERRKGRERARRAHRPLPDPCWIGWRGRWLHGARVAAARRAGSEPPLLRRRRGSHARGALGLPALRGQRVGRVEAQRLQRHAS